MKKLLQACVCFMLIVAIAFGGFVCVAMVRVTLDVLPDSFMPVTLKEQTWKEEDFILPPHTPGELVYPEPANGEKWTVWQCYQNAMGVVNDYLGLNLTQLRDTPQINIRWHPNGHFVYDNPREDQLILDVVLRDNQENSYALIEYCITMWDWENGIGENENAWYAVYFDDWSVVELGCPVGYYPEMLPETSAKKPKNPFLPPIYSIYDCANTLIDYFDGQYAIVEPKDISGITRPKLRPVSDKAKYDEVSEGGLVSKRTMIFPEFPCVTFEAKQLKVNGDDSYFASRGIYFIVYCDDLRIEKFKR